MKKTYEVRKRDFSSDYSLFDVTDSKRGKRIKGNFTTEQMAWNYAVEVAKQA